VLLAQITVKIVIMELAMNANFHMDSTMEIVTIYAQMDILWICPLFLTDVYSALIPHVLNVMEPLEMNVLTALQANTYLLIKPANMIVDHTALFIHS